MIRQFTRQSKPIIRASVRLCQSTKSNSNPNVTSESNEKPTFTFGKYFSDLSTKSNPLEKFGRQIDQTMSWNNEHLKLSIGSFAFTNGPYNGFIENGVVHNSDLLNSNVRRYLYDMKLHYVMIRWLFFSLIGVGLSVKFYIDEKLRYRGQVKQSELMAASVFGIMIGGFIGMTTTLVLLPGAMIALFAAPYVAIPVGLVCWSIYAFATTYANHCQNKKLTY